MKVVHQIICWVVIAVAGSAPAIAQERIDDSDSPTAPISVKNQQKPKQDKPSKVITSGPLGLPSAEVTVGADKAAAAGQSPAPAAAVDLDKPLPAAKETDRGVLRRPAGKAPGPVDLTYTNAKPAPTTAFPGLGMAPGSVAPGEPIVLHTKNGLNEIVKISSQFANRIVTPFDKPKLLAGDDVEGSVVGNSVYVSASNENVASGIYIVDSTGKSAAAISMTLVPSSIPQQTVIIMLDGVGKGQSEDSKKESGYESHLKSLMRSIAQGHTPQGFTEEYLAMGAAVSNGIRAVPAKRLSSSDMDAFLYQLSNTSEASVSLSEEAFAGKGVRAVAFFPKIALAPGESTQVIILADKEQ